MPFKLFARKKTAVADKAEASVSVKVPSISKEFQSNLDVIKRRVRYGPERIAYEKKYLLGTADDNRWDLLKIIAKDLALTDRVNLKHKNIIEFWGLDLNLTSLDGSYFTLSYGIYRGDNLDMIIETLSGFPCAQVKCYARQIAGGLCYLNEHGRTDLGLCTKDILVLNDTLRLNDVHAQVYCPNSIESNSICRMWENNPGSSDSCNFGRILFDMITGKTTSWDEHEHVPGNKLFDGFSLPQKTQRIFQDLLLLADQCVQADPSLRPTTEAISKHISLQGIEWPRFHNGPVSPQLYDKMEIASAMKTDTGHTTTLRLRVNSSSKAKESFMEHFVDRFLLMRTWQHPNIVRCLRLKFNQQWDAYITTNHCLSHGPPPLSCLISMTLNTAQIKRYARQILSALKYLHEMGVNLAALNRESIYLENGIIKVFFYGSRARLRLTSDTGNENNDGHIQVDLFDDDPQAEPESSDNSPFSSFGSVLLEMTFGKTFTRISDARSHLELHLAVASDGQQSPENLLLLAEQCIGIRSPILGLQEISQHPSLNVIDWPVVRQHLVSADLFDKLDRTHAGFSYRIAREIATSNAPVYIGEYGEPASQVAVKKRKLKSLSAWPSPTPQDMIADLSQAVDSFLTTRTLEHKNIVKHLAFELDSTDESNPDVNLIMEYCPGGTLLDRNRREPKLDVQEVKQYARQIIDGLVYLYQKGICHLDLKGANILLANDGTLKICDFGDFVKLRSVSHTSRNEVNREIGTVPYMAPEMINPDHAHPGRKSDIYSFGCVLIEMMTGNVPKFKSKDGKRLTTGTQISTFVSSGGTPEVPELPLDLNLLVRQCIIRDPEQRLTAQQIARHPFLHSAWDELDNKGNDLPFRRFDEKGIIYERILFSGNTSSTRSDDKDGAVRVRVMSIKTEPGPELTKFIDELSILMTVARDSHTNIVQLIGTKLTRVCFCAWTQVPLFRLYHDMLSRFKTDDAISFNEALSFDTTLSMEFCRNSLEAMHKKLKKLEAFAANGEAIAVRRADSPTVTTCTLLRIAYQVCSAMEFLEQHGVTHTNLSLDSVGVSQQFVPKVMDHEYFSRCALVEKEPSSGLNADPRICNDSAVRAYGQFLLSLRRLGEADSSTNILERYPVELNPIVTYCRSDEHRRPNSHPRFSQLTAMWHDVRLTESQIYFCKNSIEVHNVNATLKMRGIETKNYSD